MAKEPSYAEAERAAKAAAKAGRRLDEKYAKVLATNPARAGKLARKIRNDAKREEEARMAEREAGRGGGGLGRMLGPRNRGLRG